MLERYDEESSCNEYIEDVCDAGYYIGLRQGYWGVMVNLICIRRKVKKFQTEEQRQHINEFFAHFIQDHGLDMMQDIIDFAEKYPNLSSEKLLKKLTDESEFKYI